MKVPYREQLFRFVDDHGVKIIAGLGVTKGIETFIMGVIRPWWVRAIVWVILTAIVLYIAAKSPDIDV